MSDNEYSKTWGGISKSRKKVSLGCGDERKAMRDSFPEDGYHPRVSESRVTECLTSLSISVMKKYEELSTEKYRKHTNNRGKYNRWVKKQSHRQDRRGNKKDTYPGESFDDLFVGSDDDDLG